MTTPNAEYALYVIAYPAAGRDGKDTYDIHNVAFSSKEEAIAHATDFQAEWVDYFVLPLGSPVFTYTWDDEAGATQIDRSEESMTLTDNEVFAFCQRARDAGYAITAFTNEELRGCDPRDVVDAMVEAGNERIEFLAGPES